MIKHRILVIDDEASFTRLVKLNVEAAGPYDVRVVNSGSLAVTVAREFNPHLIFVDVIMRDMDGPAIVAQLKLDQKVKDIPIIFLTATLSMEQIEREKGTILGLPVVAKPISTEELIQVIEKYLKGRS